MKIEIQALDNFTKNWCRDKLVTDPNIEEEVFRMAIEALEYREPRKVIGEKNHIKQCPRCGHSCGIRWNGDYCPNCGQRLDWSDEE